MLTISLNSCDKFILITIYTVFSIKSRPNNRNMSTQDIATLLGATCCARLATLLRHVATCWVLVLLAQVLKWSNLSQQHPTCRNTVAKRAQHVAPNNVAICCVGLMRSFGRGLRFNDIRMVPSKCKSFCSRLRPRAKSTSLQALLEFTKKN